MAGMRCARGSLVAVLDCDLQDPVEMLPQYIALAETSDVVLSVRTDRGDGASRKLQSRVYAFALRLITGQSVNPRLGGISVLSSKVAAEYVKFNEPDHHFQFILKWLGFSANYVEIDRSGRVSGRSSYGFLSRIRHASSGLFFFPARIIGFAAGLGLTVFVLGVALLAFIFLSALNATPVSGWLSTVSLIVLFSGFNVALTSVVGIYVMRTFEKVKERPLYVIDEVV
jgi:dolichol-phosphate mannosyltransferase